MVVGVPGEKTLVGPDLPLYRGLCHHLKPLLFFFCYSKPFLTYSVAWHLSSACVHHGACAHVCIYVFKYRKSLQAEE